MSVFLGCAAAGVSLAGPGTVAYARRSCAAPAPRREEAFAHFARSRQAATTYAICCVAAIEEGDRPTRGVFCVSLCVSGCDGELYAPRLRWLVVSELHGSRA